MFWILKADNGGNMEISKIIKEARIKKGMTQQQLADSVYVTRQTISKWEKNYSVPDAEVFVKLADVLEVQTSQLLGVKVDRCANNRRKTECLCRATSTYC